MSERRLGAASAGLLAANAVTSLSMVLYHRHLSGTLGAGYAELAALIAVVNVLGNVTQGLNTYLVKAFSADAELKGPGAVKGRLMILLRPGLISLAVIAVLLAALSPLIKAYLKLSGVDLALIVDVLFVSGLLMLVLRAAQQGLHHFGWLGVSVAGEGLTRLGAVFSPLAGSVAGGLGALLAGQFAGVACAAAGLMGLGPARRPMKRPKGEHPLRHALSEGGSDTLALTLLALVSYLDVLVVKHYYADEPAGLYMRAAMVAKSFLYLPAALNMILLAAAAREMAGGKDPRRLLERFMLGALALDALGLAGVWGLTPFCLRMLAGPDPKFTTPDMITLTRWFSLAVIPLGLLQLVVVYLLAIRRLGVAVFMGVLALIYLGLLQGIFSFNSDASGRVLDGDTMRSVNLQVVAALGFCSLAALAYCFWSAMAKPPRRDEWGLT